MFIYLWVRNSYPDRKRQGHKFIQAPGKCSHRRRTCIEGRARNLYTKGAMNAAVKQDILWVFAPGTTHLWTCKRIVYTKARRKIKAKTKRMLYNSKQWLYVHVCANAWLIYTRTIQETQGQASSALHVENNSQPTPFFLTCYHKTYLPKQLHYPKSGLKTFRAWCDVFGIYCPLAIELLWCVCVCVFVRCKNRCAGTRT